MINKNIPIPLYYQVVTDIEAKIKSGEYKPGEKLPTEAWLMDFYGVSRVTIRKAISGLVSMGLLENRRGIGTFVASPKTIFSLANMSSLHRMLTSLNIEASSRILEDDIIPATAELANIMKIPIGSPLHMIRRIRLANGNPIAEQVTYLQVALCPDLKASDLIHRSLYEVFETEYNIKPIKSFQVFSAKLPSKEDVSNLELFNKTPLLTIFATVYDKNETVIEYSINNYVPDRYGYSITLQ